VRVEALMGGPAFFGLPGWLLQVIIPISFAIMALRFGFQFGDDLQAARSKKPVP
jgi:hypothetical protein